MTFQEILELATMKAEEAVYYYTLNTDMRDPAEQAAIEDVYDNAFYNALN